MVPAKKDRRRDRQVLIPKNKIGFFQSEYEKIWHELTSKQETSCAKTKRKARLPRPNAISFCGYRQEIEDTAEK
jgi:hypothetical protein